MSPHSPGYVVVDRVIHDGDTLPAPDLEMRFFTEHGEVVLDKNGRAHTSGGNPVRMTCFYIGLPGEQQ